jgi:uncharacterized protein YhhL (DUF1145 family)
MAHTRFFTLFMVVAMKHSPNRINRSHWTKEKMKFLLNIPLVMSFAEWVWSDDPSDNVSPEQCLESLMSSFMLNKETGIGCWSRLMAKGLGIAIVLAACLNKAPVIRNIIHSQSTAGIARYSVYGDCIVYANMAYYGIKEGHPFTAFGENVAILLQSLVIIILICKFENKPIVGFMERVMVMLFGVLYTLAVFFILPKEHNYLLISCTWPMYISSRGSQIYHTAIVAKHTGAQSLITLSLNLLGEQKKTLVFPPVNVSVSIEYKSKKGDDVLYHDANQGQFF